MRNAWQVISRFLLTWLLSSLLATGYGAFAILRGGTPNWLDALVFAGWVVIAGLWMRPLARSLARHRAFRIAVLILLLVALLGLALPSALNLPVGEGLWRMDWSGRYVLDLSSPTPRRLFLTLPQTLYIINFLVSSVLDTYRQGIFVSAALDLLDRLASERGNARLGVFLDEAEVIVPHAGGSGPDLGRYLTFLRGLVDEDGRLSLLVACLNPSISRISAWQGVQNPAFELFQEVYLPPLAQDGSAQMVCSLGRQVGLVYTDEGVAQIVVLGGGHPFLTRQFCSLLLQRREYRPGQVEAAEITAGIKRFIYDEQTVTHLDALIWQDAGNIALWGAEQAALNKSLLRELARADGPLPEARLLDAPDATAVARR